MLKKFLSKNTWRVGGELQNKTVLQLNSIDRGELLFMHFFDDNDITMKKLAFYSRLRCHHYMSLDQQTDTRSLKLYLLAYTLSVKCLTWMFWILTPYTK